MRIFFLGTLLLFCVFANAQNYLDSLLSTKGVCFISYADLTRLGVKEIKIHSFLSEGEIKRLPSTKEIKSKALSYKYFPPGQIKEVIKNYTGLDSLGINQMHAKGDYEDVLINGMIYYYNPNGSIASTLSYGAAVSPNSGYIYDHEQQLVMIRYYYDKVMHRFSESAGRTIFDYYPENGKLKYKIKLDNNGVIDKAEYFIYDNSWNLMGITESPEAIATLKPYKPYTDLGKILPWQISINNIPVDNFLFNNKITKCIAVLIQVTGSDFYLFRY